MYKRFLPEIQPQKATTIIQIQCHHIHICIFTCQLYGDTGEFTSSVVTLKMKMRHYEIYSSSIFRPGYFKISQKCRLKKQLLCSTSVGFGCLCKGCHHVAKMYNHLTKISNPISLSLTHMLTTDPPHYSS